MNRAAFNVHLGGLLKDARKGAGLPQKQVADALGISRSSVANFEAGKAALSAYQLVCAMQVLRLTRLDLAALTPKEN